MGLLDKIKWHNVGNILTLFLCVTGLFAGIYGLIVLVSPKQKSTVVTAISAADFERITAPIIHYSDSAYLARETGARRRSDSLFSNLFPRDSIYKIFQQNQQTRDEKYQVTANAADSVLLRQWQQRYGAN